MTLIRRAVRMFSLTRQLHAICAAQQQLIADQNHMLRKIRLEHQREMHGLVSAWRIHMETPEIDLRDDITALATELGNQIAALEEHVV